MFLWRVPNDQMVVKQSPTNATSGESGDGGSFLSTPSSSHEGLADASAKKISTGSSNKAAFTGGGSGSSGASITSNNSVSSSGTANKTIR